AIVSEFRMQFLAQRLEALLAAFEAARIKTLLLKGAALACTVYPGFAQRPMSDVDLLVEPGRAEEAWRLALTLGWAPVYGDQVSPIYEGHHHLAPLRDATGIDVGLELHTGILPPAHPFKLEVGALWRDALFARVGRTPALVPSHLHRILHLCAHFAWSHALREGAWRTFRDIHAIVTHESPDWDSVVESARRTRMTTCCYWTFRLAGAASGVKVPDEVLRALSPRLPAFALRRLERYFLTMITPPPHWDQPTRRLRHLLWVAGIQPRLSGHGGVRPWSRNHLFAELVHGEGHEDAPEDDAPNPWIRRAQQLMREVAVLT
ncbi:MAG TPA: nucleotidyltransferase family protein, partial [Gemmatimonadaceae bacterium]|nr:nucleotidyltransferase family protein [Gemmatimonadaceae bacterium]